MKNLFMILFTLMLSTNIWANDQELNHNLNDKEIKIEIVNPEGEIVYSEVTTEEDLQQNPRDWKLILVNAGIAPVAIIGGYTGWFITAASVGATVTVGAGVAILGSVGILGAGVGSAIVAIDELLFNGYIVKQAGRAGESLGLFQLIYNDGKDWF